MVTQTEFDQLLDVVREFIRREVIPAEASIDETDEIPARLIEQAKEMGLYGYALPTEYGGLGLSVDQQVRLTIELGYTCPAFRSLFGTNNGIAGQVLVLAGTEEQRKQWLPRLASGEVVASFALTEPDAGSDPSRLVTTAQRDGEGWVIDGLKRYITNAPAADAFMVFARTDPDAPPGKGIGVFIVPARTDGVAVAARDHKMGQAGAWTADVAFTGVRVPADALVGEEGKGFRYAMESLDKGRISVAAGCTGIIAACLEACVGYASQRHQFGQPIAGYQLVQDMIAQISVDADAARLLTWQAADLVQHGDPFSVAASKAKLFASEGAVKAANLAIQVFGGYGYIDEYPVQKFMRDARVMTLYEGTSQIQKLLIGRAETGISAF
jgi:alkylation response protein AidB-like acyl-CoA dehydrogenase